MADRLVEGLAYEWRVERNVEVLLLAAAERVARPDTVARLQELAAAARARRTRIERRLDALKGGRRLAAVPGPIDRLDELFETALAQARASGDRYGVLAELSRRLSDPETAFACELNRIGVEEAAALLEVMMGSEVERGVLLPGLPVDPAQPGA
jgi:hypothetical protein